MAPSFHMFQDSKNSQLSALKKTKIRKPVIEKMRRDRINNSIEHLRLLLGKDIQAQHQHSKLEKADILEMAVQYLQHQRQHGMTDPQNAQDLYYQGYYMCLKETMRFLHNPENAQGKILRNICRHKNGKLSEHKLHSPAATPPRDPSESTRDIWRPW